MASYTIRTARFDELPGIQEIERRAATRLGPVGLPAAMDLPIHPIEAWRTHCEQGRLFVAADEHDRPVAFVVFETAGDDVHLEEIDVEPEHAGQGLGRRLIQAVIEWAKSREFRQVTLTTFRDIPFNAPFYARLGFRIVDEGTEFARLSHLRQAERQNGFEIAPRVAMALDLTTGSATNRM